MKNYSISDLENYSGIKAHTLRTWEKRYGLFSPRRNTSNFRYYSTEDLSHLLKLCLLTKVGYKISQLAVMDQALLNHNIASLTHEEDVQLRELNKLIISMLSMNTEEFDSVLNNYLLLRGIDKTIKNMVMPFIERVQIFSCKNCEGEIDFAITALRQKLIFGIEKIEPSNSKEKTALLFLPEGEHYDLLLLYFKYIIQTIGFKVLYMGTNVSVKKLKEITLSKQPDYLLTYISPKQKLKLSEIKDFVTENLPKSVFLVAGFANNMTQEADTDLRFIHHAEVHELLN